MIKSQTILGIDPGTNFLGFGLVRINDRGQAEFLDAGVLELHREADSYCKLERIYSFVDSLCKTYSPQCLAVESPFMGKNAQVVFKLGRAQGVVIAAAKSHGMEIFEYAPRKAKIAVCGNGAASKEQVSTMVQKSLGIKIEYEHLDCTDALAIALCHYYHLTSPLASGKSSGSSWEKFIAANPNRINK